MGEKAEIRRSMAAPKGMASKPQPRNTRNTPKRNPASSFACFVVESLNRNVQRACLRYVPLWHFGLHSAFGFRPSDFRRLFSACLPLVILAAAGCRRDMFHQPSSRPLEASDFFQDNGMASRPLVPHSIARGHLDANTVFYTGKVGTNLVDAFPFPITQTVLERGREQFDIYCSPCHGRTGEGNGMIVQRGFPAPPSYHMDRLRKAPVGYFFDVMSHGYGVMYSYAERVQASDRWAIAAYIRVLQKSENSTLAEVPPEQRTALEQGK